MHYKDYGGRGIQICDEWLGNNGFQNFYEWAMANGYDENAPRGQCTIDRIDNDKGYSPDNCRWVTARKQCNNTRKNHNLEFNGKTQSIAMWGRELGVPTYLINQRINKYGWTVEKALTTPKPIKRK